MHCVHEGINDLKCNGNFWSVINCNAAFTSTWTPLEKIQQIHNTKFNNIKLRIMFKLF